MGNLILKMGAQHEEYLRDESKWCGAAEEIAFAKTEAEVAEVLKHCRERKIPVTVQGSRTGIAGGAVPSSGMILNLSKMNRITGLRREGTTFYVEVEPGVLLSDLTDRLQRRHFQTDGWSEESLAALRELRNHPELHFALAPTETSATIGGMASTNAKGILKYTSGRMADYVQRLTLMRIDGQIWDVERGAYVADTEGCKLPDGSMLPCMAQARTSTPLTLIPGQDLIDLVIGSEGMLGVITSLELRLDERPESVWGLMFFFAQERDAFAFLDGLEKQDIVVAVEYFDRTALDIVMAMKRQMTRLRGIPELPEGSAAGVYMEIWAEDEDTAEMALGDVLEHFVSCGGDEEATWAASGEGEMEKFRLFRHAVPEGVNQQVDRLRRNHPELHKLGVDFRRAGKTPAEVITAYREDAEREGVKAVIFGHAADLHFHVNLLPETDEQRYKAKGLLEKWAEETTREGGCLTAEHGIGKVKAKLISGCLTDETLHNMRQIKNAFDREHLLNQGNMGIY